MWCSGWVLSVDCRGPGFNAREAPRLGANSVNFWQPRQNLVKSAAAMWRCKVFVSDRCKLFISAYRQKTFISATCL